MGKTKDVSHQELMEVINSFDFGGKLEEVGIFGNGHINETYCAVFSTEAGQKRYILQKMNKQIFKDPVGLMENISGVTSWLKKKILENGGDAERETLNIVNDRAGAPYFVDKEGEYWRAYLFIEDATCFDQVILDAITYHTTGRPNMTLMDKIIFVADYIEPNRKMLPEMEEIRKEAFTDLDACVIHILKNTLDYLNRTTAEMDYMTQKTYDFYVVHNMEL